MEAAGVGRGTSVASAFSDNTWMAAYRDGNRSANLHLPTRVQQRMNLPTHDWTSPNKVELLVEFRLVTRSKLL